MLRNWLLAKMRFKMKINVSNFKVFVGLFVFCTFYHQSKAIDDETAQLEEKPLEKPKEENADLAMVIIESNPSTMETNETEATAFKPLYENSKSPPVQLSGFENCDTAECNQICGLKDNKKSFCEPKNKKLCMCAMDNFMSSNVEGSIAPVNRDNPDERNCSVACNIRNSYARIWRRLDGSKSCNCLLNQITSTGITLCDEFAVKDLCKSVCQSQTAVCAFNGVCLCHQTWRSAFDRSLPNVRNEVETDKQECSKRCKEYHTEFVSRIFDSKKDIAKGVEKTYEFRDKYCLCGDEIEPEDTSMMHTLHEQGFQECTDLKCKVRCGMNPDAVCEPKYRRACLCPRHNIFIGKHLWARLPSKKETVCQSACSKASLAARVIEWNPFFDPRLEKFSGVYRKSRFRYLYDGKFCHCISIKNEPDTSLFRPCTNELCQWLCGHTGATCDPKTRRVCICNTHQMLAGLGRKPDPGEGNCNVICRRNLYEARILELHWDIPPPPWTVQNAKFCGCIRPVTPAGLTHCDRANDQDSCPKMCSNPEAYCTKDRVCECFIQPKILENPLIRVPNGKEADECGEVCRSWTWPMAEDLDHQPYIYDESRQDCVSTNSCPAIDTTPWDLTQPGALKVSIDALEENTDKNKKYCLCVKSDYLHHQPGIRILMEMKPPQLPKNLHCIFNYTCIAAGIKVHIVG